MRVNEVLDAIARKPRLYRPWFLGAGKRLQGFEVGDHLTRSQLTNPRSFIACRMDRQSFSALCSAPATSGTPCWIMANSRNNIGQRPCGMLMKPPHRRQNQYQSYAP